MENETTETLSAHLVGGDRLKLLTRTREIEKQTGLPHAIAFRRAWLEARETGKAGSFSNSKHMLAPAKVMTPAKREEFNRLVADEMKNGFSYSLAFNRVCNSRGSEFFNAAEPFVMKDTNIGTRSAKIQDLVRAYCDRNKLDCSKAKDYNTAFNAVMNDPANKDIVNAMIKPDDDTAQTSAVFGTNAYRSPEISSKVNRGSGSNTPSAKNNPAYDSKNKSFVRQTATPAIPAPLPPWAASATS